MIKTEVQEHAEGLRSRINEATDLDSLKEYSLKIVDLLTKIDQLVGLGEERWVLADCKLEAVTTVANGLIELLEAIEESSTILNNVSSYSAAIAAARDIIEA